MRLNSHSRLNLIRALLQAIEAGADEALMLDPFGFVSSCNATNFFLRTRRRGEHLARRVLLQWRHARSSDQSVPRRGRARSSCGILSWQRRTQADEAFVTGTFGGITPVRAIDGHRLPGALPGPVTRRVHQLYVDLQDSQAAPIS